MIPPLHLIILVNSLTQMEGLKGKIKYSEDSQTLSVSLLVYFQSRSLDILSSGHLAIFWHLSNGSINSSLETHAQYSVSGSEL